jgi:predicted lipoprotein with Yx(FWY)xxD motif
MRSPSSSPTRPRLPLLLLASLVTWSALPGCGDDDDLPPSTGGRGSGGSAGARAGSSSTAGKNGGGSTSGGVSGSSGGVEPEAGSGGALGVAGGGSGGGGAGAGGGGGDSTNFPGSCPFHTDANVEGGAAAGGAAGGGGTGGAGGEGGAPNADVGLEKNAGLGSVLTDSAGRTLYIFGSDVPGDCNNLPVMRCAGSCLATWPPFAAGSRSLAEGLNDAAFGDFTPAIGAPEQTTFNGWPLYLNFGEAPGQITGEGAAKGLWHVAKLPFYNIMLMKKKLSDALSATYIADGAGFALYVSSADSTGNGSSPNSACTEQCAVDWPPFSLDRFIAPSSFTDGDFSLFARTDGHLQVAYRGQPLYRFADDQKPGDTNGHGVGSFSLANPAL